MIDSLGRVEKNVAAIGFGGSVRCRRFFCRRFCCCCHEVIVRQRHVICVKCVHGKPDCAGVCDKVCREWRAPNSSVRRRSFHAGRGACSPNFRVPRKNLVSGILQCRAVSQFIVFLGSVQCYFFFLVRTEASTFQRLARKFERRPLWWIRRDVN